MASNLNEKYDRRELPLSLQNEELAELFQSLSGGLRVVESHLLSGGFANTNYKIIADNGRSYVARFSQRDNEDSKKEVAVLNLIKSKVPVPGVVAVGNFRSRPVAIMEFIEGTLLSEWFSSTANPQEIRQISSEVGRVLRAIHSVEMENSGFFDSRLHFTTTFRNFGQGYIDYMSSCLSSKRVRSRMGEDLSSKAKTLLEKFEIPLKELGDTQRLLHCDFNPKNMIVRHDNGQWKVAAILDWEFAASGSPLVDLANFLRFEDEYPPELELGLLEGYGEDSKNLPSNWKPIAKVLDLASMFSFLDSEEDHPKTFRTAISVFEKTIAMTEEQF